MTQKQPRAAPISPFKEDVVGFDYDHATPYNPSSIINPQSWQLEDHKFGTPSRPSTNPLSM